MNTSALNFWQGRSYAPVPDAPQYALPMILNLSDDRLPSQEECLIAAAMATARYLTSDEAMSNQPLLLDWMRSNIRKVTRRAKNSGQWEKASSLPGVTTTYVRAEVRVLHPHLLHEVPTEIKRLQVSGWDVESSHIRSESFFTPKSNPTLMLSHSPLVEMSTGKLMAQFGHAAQLALLSESLLDDIVAEWSQNEFPVALTDTWAPQDTEIAVYDAGHTEVPAGTRTVQGHFSEE